MPHPFALKVAEDVMVDACADQAAETCAELWPFETPLASDEIESVTRPAASLTADPTLESEPLTVEVVYGGIEEWLKDRVSSFEIVVHHVHEEVAV